MRSSAAVAAVAVLSACHHCKVEPPPGSLFFPHTPVTGPIGPLPVPDPKLRAELLAAPVIDIHAHTFNALYLPLRGIALGRNQDFLPVPVLGDAVALILVNALVARALENQEPARFIARSAAPAALALPPGSIAAQLGLDYRTGRPQALATPTAEDRAVRAALADDDNFRKLAALFGVVEHSPSANRDRATLSVARVSDVVAFLRALVSSDTDLRAQAPRDFDDGVELFVHHTMDMARTYAQEPDNSTFWSFRPKQIERVRKLDHSPVSDGRFLHFVAFNPFNAEPARPAGGWRNSVLFTEIRDAVARGAWGVKFYPPAGYRPAHNAPPRRPGHPTLAAQWDSRYGHLSGPDLDELNYALFEFCADNGIPVFAHCGTGEFQAAACYGEMMAHPAYYRSVLERLRDAGKSVRLCLGHSGGPAFWFGLPDAELKEWGEQVYELCTRFPDVYCEVGILAEVAESSARARFTARLTALIQRPVPLGGYDFGAKIMYGSDWFMPDAAGRQADFLGGYREVFLANTVLAARYRDFFAGNALRYLGARKRFDDPTFPLPDRLRERLGRLLAGPAGP